MFESFFPIDRASSLSVTEICPVLRVGIGSRGIPNKRKGSRLRPFSFQVNDIWRNREALCHSLCDTAGYLVILDRLDEASLFL